MTSILPVAVEQTKSVEDLIKPFRYFLLKELNYSEKTADSYESDLLQFCRFLDQNLYTKLVSQIDKKIIRRYKGSISDWASPSTICRKIHALRSFFRYAVEEDYCESNPASDIRLPKKTNRKPRFLTTEEVKGLLDTATDVMDKTILLMLYYTGARRAEVIETNIGDINWEHGILMLKGKGRKERPIFLHPVLLTALKAYISIRPCVESEALFVTGAGHRISPTFMHNMFRCYLRKAGFENRGFTLHCMRHTFGTALGLAGKPLPAIRDLMGHASLDTTSIYLHSDGGSRTDAVASLPTF